MQIHDHSGDQGQRRKTKQGKLYKTKKVKGGHKNIRKNSDYFLKQNRSIVN
jgi:hypothetical protein